MRDASTVATRKRYDEDAYLTEVTARVISFQENDLVLDETVFFPEEGGQSPDRGTIEGFAVADVQIRDGEIHHYLKLDGDEDRNRAEACFREGQTVHGSIDFDFRYSNMQMHSGEHLFSGLVHSEYGYDNVGFHLSPNEMTMDFSGPLTREELLAVEQKANEAVFRNIPSQIVYLKTEEERDSMEYRSKIDFQGEVRVVIYPGYDACACCAPHVKRTGEIGLIKVAGVQNWKGGVRVSLVCGIRAQRLLSRHYEILSKTAAFLSASPEDVCQLTVKLKEEHQEQKSRIKEMGRRLLEAEAAAIAPDEVHAVLFEEGVDTRAVRDAVNQMVEVHEGYSAVFVKTGDGTWSYIIGSKHRNCRDVSARLTEQFHARGGGKPEMVQGSVTASAEELRALFSDL